MKTLKGTFLSTLLAVFIILPLGHANNETETLRDIKGINVSIATRFSEGVNVSFNNKMIKTYFESLLKDEGITLLSEEAFLTSHGSARLRLSVQITKHKKEKNIHAYNIELELRQNVILERNRKIGISAPTWEESITGIVLRNYVEETVRDSAEDLVGRFLNAYWEANPRQSGNPTDK